MALTLGERFLIEADIEQLYEAVPLDAVADRDQVREYIDVGEYGLALDDLAAIYLERAIPLRAEVLALFEKLAMKMGMRPGDEWQAVSEVLSAK